MVDFHTQFVLSNTSWAPAAIALLNGGGIRDSVVSGMEQLHPSLFHYRYRGITGGFLLLRNFSVAISVSPHV